MVKMYGIDTKLTILKNVNHYDTYLEYLCTIAGMKDWLSTIFEKTQRKRRRDYRNTTKTLLKLEINSISVFWTNFFYLARTGSKFYLIKISEVVIHVYLVFHPQPGWFLGILEV